jgi:hypothetical protein
MASLGARFVRTGDTDLASAFKGNWDVHLLSRSPVAQLGKAARPLELFAAWRVAFCLWEIGTSA